MKYKSIISLKNPTIKEILKIKERRYKDKDKLFLIEGIHLIEMALDSSFEIKMVFFSESFKNKTEGQRLLRKLIKRNTELIQISDEINIRLSDTESPQGVLALLSFKTYRLQDIQFKGNSFIVVCDGIQDPGNLGTIIRASDAACVDAVVILPNTCDVFMHKTLRATAGSIFNIPIVHSDLESLLEYLRLRGITLYSTDIRAERLIYETDFNKPIAIAFGNEARGVSETLRKMSDLIKIPIIGKAESLNVAMAASVCLYEIVRQRMYKMNY